MTLNLINIEEAKKIPTDELLKKLSSSEKGLSVLEAQKRIQQYGPNDIIEKKVNPIIKFLKNFWGPIPWMIEAAVILSAILQHWDDFGIILALLIINALIGFWQEHKAENAIELLKKRLAPKARVKRDDNWFDVPARELVPGDIIFTRLGDIVPADIKLINGEYLLADESALTGESLPVEKYVSDIAYDGSTIRQGEMIGIVVSTGMNTIFGKTAKLIEGAKARGHFQQAVIKIGNYLIIIAISLVALIFIAAVIRHESLVEIFQFALVLIVAAIPAALPVVLSVTMVIGAVELAKKAVIIRKLTALDEIAGVDILCSDKTGTITKNELSIAELRPLSEFTDNDILFFASLASRKEGGDPIDNVIISSNTPELVEKLSLYKVITFKSFDPVVKRTEATVQDDNGNEIKVTKGAPQVILDLVAEKDLISTEFDEIITSLASKGYRALGVAKTNPQENWQYIGIIGIYDSPREDSAETIRLARSMGIKVKMVTGDHVAIAKEIANQINLGTNIIPVSDFLDKPENEALPIIDNADGFAQVFPEHKYRIVELLQSEGKIVGMTGDGVNDAPALKKADVGIAVGGATDAARSAAEIVLTKPGLSVIIDAIKESRKIFQRMNNYATFRIAETIRIIIFLTLSILIFDFYPITAVMIVLLALLNDGPIIMIAYDNASIQEKPVHWEFRRLMILAILLGVLGVISSFLLFWIAESIFHIDRQTIQTIIFLKMTVAGHMTLYLARTQEKPFWSRPLPAPILFFVAEITQVAGTILAVYGAFMTPIGWILALIIWGYAFMFFIINNFVKTYVYKLINWRKKRK